MDAIGTVVLLLGAAYPILYVLTSYLIRRVTKDDTENDKSPTTVHNGPDSSPSRTEQSSAVTGPASVVCPACDAENDREYNFCRQCVAVLPDPT